jgi:hypothetical protein
MAPLLLKENAPKKDIANSSIAMRRNNNGNPGQANSRKGQPNGVYPQRKTPLPSSSKSSEAAAAVAVAAREVDFLLHPTILSRLIVRQKYGSALKRLWNHPDESSVWVCTRRPGLSPASHSLNRRDSWPGRNGHAKTTKTDYSLRQLPIHVACNNLVFYASLDTEEDTTLRQELERLIAELVRSYPQACGKRDEDGRLPLHHAIWLDASPSTVSVLINAYPEALAERDAYGHLPLQLLNETRRTSGRDKETIAGLLQRGTDVWQQSRNVAMVRLQLPVGIRPTSTEAIDSTTFLQRSNTNTTGHTEDEQVLSQEETTRCAQLEEMLSEMYERNYELGQVITSLTSETQKMQQILDMHTETGIGKQKMLLLEDENSDLNKKLLRLGIVLRDLGLNSCDGQTLMAAGSDEDNDSLMEPEGISMLGMDPEPSTVLIKYLENKIGVFLEENDALILENESFEKRVAELEALTQNPHRQDASASREDGEYLSPHELLSATPGPENIAEKDEYSSSPPALQKEPAFSDNERLLVAKVLTLQRQLDEARRINAEAASALSTSSGVEVSSARKQSLDLEARLKMVDRRSGNDVRGLVLDDDDDRSEATPVTRNSSVAENVRSVHRVESKTPSCTSKGGESDKSKGGESDKTASSWGLLSLTQSKSPRTATLAATISRKNRRREMPEIMPTLPQGEHSFMSLSLNDSMASFADTVSAEMDNLDELFKSAADFYDGYQKADMLADMLFDGHKSAMTFGQVVPPERSRRRARRFSDGGASPAVVVRKMPNESRNVPEAVPDPLVATARILAADEELVAIIREAEQKLGTPIPRALFLALRDVSLHTATSINDSSNLSVAESFIDYKLIDAAELAYGEPIPSSAVSALRAASSDRIETSQKEIAMMENLKARLKEELYDALIDQAERQMHKRVPFDIVVALRKAGSKFDSLLYEVTDDDADVYRPTPGMFLDFKEMDRMFKEAQRLHEAPFPQGILIALRRASFVLQSRLEGTDFGEDPTTRSIDPTAGVSVESPGRYSAENETRTSIENFSSMDKVGSSSFESRDKESLPKEQLRNSKSYSSRSSPAARAAAVAAERHSRKLEHIIATNVRIEDKADMQSLAEKSVATAEVSLSLHNVFPSLGSKKGYGATLDDQTDGRSTTSAEESISLHNVFPLLESRKANSGKPGDLERKLGHVTRESSSKKGAGRDLPLGEAYRRVRSRSRSPSAQDRSSGDLSELYGRTSMALSRSPSPQSRKGRGDDIGQIYRQASPDARNSASLRLISQALARSEAADEPADEISHSADSLESEQDEDAGVDVSADELELDEDERNNDADDMNDMRSTDFSKVSRETEDSLDILALFEDDSKPSELESKLKNLGEAKKSKGGATSRGSTGRRSQESSGRGSSMSSISISKPGNKASTNAKAEPQRRARRSKSGDLELLAANTRADRRGKLRPTKSAGPGELPDMANAIPSTNMLDFVDLAASIRSDDLDTIFKHAARQADAKLGCKSPVAEDSNTTLLASTDMPKATCVAALETIVTDTEATYGIEIPSELVDALRRACIGALGDTVPFISIVKALHYDEIIEEAEIYYGQSIPIDLLAAMRSTSLPPGVSIEKLKPADESSSASASALLSPRTSATSIPSLYDDIWEAPGKDDASSEDADRPANAAPPGFKAVDPHHEGPQSDTKRKGRILGAREKPPLDLSQHSDTSWGRLSVSGSPIVLARKQAEEENTRKKLQAARPKRESADDFMNSLADLGGPTDDLRQLFKHAVDTLESYSVDRKKLKTDAICPSPGPPVQQLSTPPTRLESVVELSESHGSLHSIESETRHYVPRPKSLESCMKLSPQELELDMLLNAVEKYLGSELPFEVDIALRKASRSTDETIDFISAVKAQVDRVRFGTHLPVETLEILFRESEVFLGHSLPSQLFSALRRTSDALHKSPDAWDDNDGGRTEKIDTRQKTKSSEGSPVNGSSNAPNRQRVATSPLSPKSNHSVGTLFVPESITPPTLQGAVTDATNNNSGTSKSTHSIDTLFSVADTRKTDDLGELYRAAYYKSPRTDLLSPQRQNSPPAPQSYNSTKVKRDPVHAVSSPRREEVMERTESEISPITECSIGTDGGSFRELDPFDVMDASKVRLLALSSNIPGLDITEDENDAVNGTEHNKQNESDMPDLDSMSEPVDGAGPSYYDHSDDSADASAELNAIIAETQAEFGMELPSELVEALMSTSISSLVSDADTMTMSEVSSMTMQALREEDETTNGGSNKKEFVAALQKKLSISSERSARSAAVRLEFICNAEKELNAPIPKDIIQALRTVDKFHKSSHGRTTVSVFGRDKLERTLVEAAEIIGRPIGPEKLLDAFRRASSAIKVPSDGPEESKYQDGDVSTQADASGYFSAVSESDGNSVSLDGFSEDRTQEIIKETDNLEWEVEDLAREKLRTLPGEDKNQDSLDLDYSASTFASLGSSNSKYLPSDNRSVPDKSLVQTTEGEKQTELEKFIYEATKEYGKPLPPEVVLAVSSMSESILSDSQLDSVIDQTEKIYGELLSNALRKASIKSAAYSTISSATTLDNSNNSSESEWTVDDALELGGLLDMDMNEKDEKQSEPSPPPTSTPGTPHKVPPSKNIGQGLLVGVQKTYKEKFPLELSYVLTRSSALQSAMNTDEEIQIIMSECEEMSGKRLPADLLLALREASVANRGSDNSSRSKRSRMIRQSSASFRSSSRSSEMPSIQEAHVDQGDTAKIEAKEKTGVLLDAINFISIAVENSQESKASDGSDHSSSVGTNNTMSDPSSIAFHSKKSEPSPVISTGDYEQSSATFESKKSEHSMVLEGLQRPQSPVNKTGVYELSSPRSSSVFNPFDYSFTTAKVSNRGGLGNLARSQFEIEPIDLNIQMDFPPESALNKNVSDGRDETPVVFGSHKSSMVSHGRLNKPPLEGMESDDLSAILMEAARRS